MKRAKFSTTYLCRIVVMQTLFILVGLANPVDSKAQIPTAEQSETAEAIAENAKVAEALKELLASMEIKEFVYHTEGRTDPFLPFISQKVMQEVAETTTPEKLTGMRQFEPGQLTLVAIIFNESSPMAMVEDASHKGYIVRKGTKIGRSGTIVDILPNQVIIKQLSYSMGREKKYKTVEMSLRKEGEK